MSSYSSIDVRINNNNNNTLLYSLLSLLLLDYYKEAYTVFLVVSAVI